jgi:hypothetical protein
MKLNLVQDFQTGIYDYNLMTSAFVALTPVNGRPPGSPTKVSFSAQEWCGLVFAEAVFDRNVVRLASHSYFDGEGDLEARLAAGPETLSEDALLMWARGLCAPKLEPGGRASVTLLRSLEESRLLHSGLVTSAAKLARSARTQRVSVPAGTFEADVFTAEIAGGRTWTFHVERAAPRRVLRWQASDGRRAELLASGRFEYWKMNAEGFERQLSKLGLERRAPRTP